MSARINSFERKQKHLHSFRNRLRKRFKRTVRGYFVNLKDSYLLTLNGQDFKRLVLRDSYLASSIANNLRIFRSHEFFPVLVRVDENEIWLEFVEGTIVTPNEDVVRLLAKIYATIYKTDPKKISSELFNTQAHEDLLFLKAVRVVNDMDYHKLDSKLDDVTPEQAWVGFDYDDPFLNNMVLADNGKLRIIDVESITNDDLLGKGVVKAFTLWMEPYRNEVFEILKDQCVPDFATYLPFVELCYFADWIKRSVIQGKYKLVQPSLFDRFL